MLRIAVVGNCQSVGLTDSINAISLGAKATCFNLSKLKTMTEREATANAVGEFDVVLSHKIEDEAYGPISAAELQN